MNTGMMINLIDSLIQSFVVAKGMIQRAPWRKIEGVPQTMRSGVPDYLPVGALRSIRFSNIG
ncbi:MAG: hypothetical protein CMJ45_02070 [Planctomyces sp.]|nr:hypothetical protein [Planctomyces sp.]